MRNSKATPRHKRAGRTVSAATTTSTVFEAGSASRRTVGWFAPTLSPNREVIPQLSLLRARARAAVRNDGYATGVISKLTSNIVGTGIKPLSEAADKAFRLAAHALWYRWTDESDADGLLDFYGQQRQAVSCWLTAGEVFVRLRDRLPIDGLSVPLQVQVIEPEVCPETHFGVALNGNLIRAGIEFDKIGRRVAYYFYAPSKFTSLDDYNTGEYRRIPAEQVIHLYDPVRPGQLRGTPHLSQALITLRELTKFNDAMLLRQQLSAMFVAFLKHSQDESSAAKLAEAEPAGNSGGRPALGLQPGLFQDLAPGEEVDFSKPPDPAQGSLDFVKQVLYSVAAATDVPYEVLTGDLRGVNDRTVRVILHEFRRVIQSKQHHIVVFQLCRTVWNAWLDRAFLSQALPFGGDYLSQSYAWQRACWQPQGWPYIHPVQDVQAQKDANRGGFTSRSQIAAEQGEDSEVIDAQQAVDNARADSLGLKYDSDGRKPASGSGAGAGANQDAGGGDVPPDAGGDSNA